MPLSTTSLREYRETWEAEQVRREETVPHFAERFREGWIPRDAEPYYPRLGGRPTSEMGLAKKIIDALDSKEGIFLLGDCEAKTPKLIEALRGVTEVPSEILSFIRDGERAAFMLDREAYFTNGGLIDVYVQWYVSRDAI